MAVLLEGVSLVFENMVLEKKYPGGVLGFRAAWDNGSYWELANARGVCRRLTPAISYISVSGQPSHPTNIRIYGSAAISGNNSSIRLLAYNTDALITTVRSTAKILRSELWSASWLGSKNCH